MQGRIFIGLLIAIVAPEPGSWAGLILNPARPITHQVSIQVIQTALNDGTSPATLFGDEGQQADIESKIDAIWAQAGIDIGFLPTISRYDNTFAYQGFGGTRPTEDLNTIIAGARGVGLLHDDRSVINMFFVDVVPGFKRLSESQAAGLAQVGANGITQFVGDGLLDSSDNRAIVAAVVAHEIGHNLGLKHTTDRQANLMSPDGVSEQLSEAQISAVLATTRRIDSVAYIPTGGTGFPQLIDFVTLAGDYNSDGAVDAADYTVWRNSRGSTQSLAADGNADRLVDHQDYAIWKNNFGQTGSEGHGATSAVPEPSALALIGAAMFTIIVSRYVVATGGRPAVFSGSGRQVVAVPSVKTRQIRGASWAWCLSQCSTRS